MTDQARTPRLTEQGARRAEAREDRLARALRENLLRRKAQQRAREAAAVSEAAAPAPGTDPGGR